MGDVRLDLHLPDAPQCSTVFSGQVSQVRDAFGTGKCSFRPIATHDEQSRAPRCHGADHVGGYIHGGDD